MGNKIITREEAMNRASISIRELCELTGISRVSAYRLVKRNQIETIKIGSKILVPFSFYGQLIDSKGGAA